MQLLRIGDADMPADFLTKWLPKKKLEASLWSVGRTRRVGNTRFQKSGSVGRYAELTSNFASPIELFAFCRLRLGTQEQDPVTLGRPRVGLRTVAVVRSSVSSEIRSQIPLIKIVNHELQPLRILRTHIRNPSKSS